MSDVMLDLETMGNGPNAAIVSVGAVEFDVTANTLGQQFYRVVNLETSVADGGVIDASTVMWWMRQSVEARNDICGDGLPLRQVLAEFAGWLATLGEDVKVWGNGAAFDNVILSQAYRRVGLPVPWKYQNDRCYRTVKAMRPDVKIERTGTHHNAIDDATSQAVHLMTLLTANASVMGCESVSCNNPVGPSRRFKMKARAMMIGDYDHLSKTYAICLIADEAEVDASSLNEGDEVNIEFTSNPKDQP